MRTKVKNLSILFNTVWFVYEDPIYDERQETGRRQISKTTLVHFNFNVMFFLSTSVANEWENKNKKSVESLWAAPEASSFWLYIIIFTLSIWWTRHSVLNSTWIVLKGKFCVVSSPVDEMMSTMWERDLLSNFKRKSQILSECHRFYSSTKSLNVKT